MTTYTPPSPEDMERLKQELGKSSTEMAELFGISTGRQWRKYMAADANNSRDMGMHMLFFAMARLELDAATIERILNRMRAAGATIELDSE
ncbi:XRE family transcriptional regulator [Burkholderia vietnamiensis]|uniref:XRE family transcriptional regulator n=1 Tax=Burkholderia vietnamiensis TaxID=60552 RepID=UPI001B96DF0E|nr:XRE family transcriptional regulator [Burkholderia vietnamiensis]MBR8214700.1 XRE family transcriptional regulator [Burkholderia vietnamiensis]